MPGVDRPVNRAVRASVDVMGTHRLTAAGDHEDRAARMVHAVPETARREAMEGIRGAAGRIATKSR